MRGCAGEDSDNVFLAIRRFRRIILIGIYTVNNPSDKRSFCFMKNKKKKNAHKSVYTLYEHQYNGTNVLHLSVKVNYSNFFCLKRRWPLFAACLTAALH